MLSHRLFHAARKLRVAISLLLAVTALALALPASPAANAAPAARTANGSVAIVDFAFDPQVVTITAGSSVQWANAGAAPHTATSDTGLWDSGNLGPGNVFSTTFTAPGNYAYHCAIHFSMQGRVVVLTAVYLPVIRRA